MFWITLLTVLAEIAMLLIKRFILGDKKDTVAFNMANQKVSLMRKRAIRTRSLAELVSYRDALRA